MSALRQILPFLLYIYGLILIFMYRNGYILHIQYMPASLLGAKTVS